MTKKETEKEKKKEEKKKEKKVEEKESKEKEKKPPKFKFECTRCGKCCTNREPIPVSFDDIVRWTKQGSFMNIILPHLRLKSLSEEDEIAKIAISPFIMMKDADEDGIGTCPFYDDENKMCNIYFTMPVFCKTFPLSFNGEKYYVSDSSCPGIGKGEMTKEKLTEMRETAVRDFTERSETNIGMVPLQGLFIRYFMEQSQEQVDRLSEDDKKKLDELVKKSSGEEKK